MDRSALLLLQQAQNCLNQGAWVEARQACQEFLSHYPEHPEGWHLLGIIDCAQGHAQAGLSSLHKALEQAPGSAHIHNNLANVLAQLGQEAQAIHHYRAALQSNPHLFEAAQNLGNLLYRQAKWQEALQAYQQALKLQPRSVRIMALISQQYIQLGQWTEAEKALISALRWKPSPAEARQLLTPLALQLVPHCTISPQTLRWLQAIVNLNPEHPGLWQQLITLCNDLGQFETALKGCEALIKLQPENAQIYAHAGTLYQELGMTEQARSAYQKSYQLKPEPGLAFKELLALSPLYPNRASQEESILRFQSQLQKLLQAPPPLQDPYREVGITPFYLNYSGVNDTLLMQQLAELYLRSCPQLNWTAPHCQTPDHLHNRRIRIGFISYYFENHTISDLFKGLLGALDRDRFEVTTLMFRPPQDESGHWIAARADHNLVLPRDLWLAREQIAAQKLDILFYTDLGMEALTYFLAFARLAPLQCMTWGHPVTSGLPHMDAFFSSEALETENAPQYYSETLVRMPLLLPYLPRPQLRIRPFQRSDFGLPEQIPLYLCPQSLFKLHPDFDCLLAEILSLVSQSRLLLLEGAYPQWTALLKKRLELCLGPLSKQVHWIPRQSPDRFLGLFQLADIILDPIWFGGGKTSYEAFALGKPVVTRADIMLRGRITTAQYVQMGLPHLPVDTNSAYVKLAVNLGLEYEKRVQLSQEIHQRADQLFNRSDTVRDFERELLMLLQTKGYQDLPH